MSDAINLALAAASETYKRQATVAELQKEVDEYKAALILKRAEKKAKGEKGFARANPAPNQELTHLSNKSRKKKTSDPIIERGQDSQGLPLAAIAQKPLPSKGTISAKQCLNVLGAVRSSREDKIAAIAGFNGYDRKGEYAIQEYQARLAALRTVIPSAKLTTLKPQRHLAKADPNCAGYVKGAYVPDKAKILDLQARELLAASEMSKHFNLALCAKSEYDEKLNQGKAELAEARVKAIREELFSLRGE